MRRSLTLIVTERCNLACSYCYCRKDVGEMSAEVARRAVDLALDSAVWAPEADGINFDFIGGEPLLRADFIGDVLDYAHERLRGHRWEKAHGAGLTTNGLLYDTHATQRLLASNRCLSIGMTVDGPAAVHDAARRYPDGSGSHADVARAARLWLKQFPGAETSTKVTLGRDTVAHLAESVLYLLFELRVPQVHANAVFEGPWLEADAAVFEEQLLRLGRSMITAGLKLDRCSLFAKHIGGPVHPEDDGTWCGCGKWMLACAPDGGLYPCNRFAPSGTPRHAVPVGDVWVGLDAARLAPFSCLSRRAQEPEECRVCDVKGGCAWCKGHDYDEGHLETRSTSLCLMHKARVRANRVLWAEAGR
jgi:uncharacterized protein